MSSHYKILPEEQNLRKRQELGLEADDFVIIMIAELNENKNQIQLIKALEILKNKHKNIKALCVGEGNKLNELTKMVTSYGVKHIDEEPYNEMVDLLYQNDDSIDNYKIEVKPDEKIVSVSVDKATKGFFGKIINKEMYKEKSSYVGKIENEKIIIEEGAK